MLEIEAVKSFDDADRVTRLARQVLKVFLVPMMVYPFFIPITPSWADVAYIALGCAFLFFALRIGLLKSKRHKPGSST